MQLVYKIKHNEISTAQNFFFPRVQYKISVHAHWEIELISLQFLLVLAVPAILGFSYTQILLFTTYIFDYMWSKVPSFQGPHPALHCLWYRKPRESCIIHILTYHDLFGQDFQNDNILKCVWVDTSFNAWCVWQLPVDPLHSFFVNAQASHSVASIWS